ncbi:WD repeat-containing protein 43 [Cylas formicarius]|uniref:WD repeat-containing protein 43 n=1 Tax=Cylas formicarius TaxID=197179 RepID=UPI002958B961|nr:WD repeat-containing protein 43 [Cylas formicarius]
MVNMALQFSEDGKYFAQITLDGKLKIWNTVSNSLEQEFTPDFHLTTPCTCLHFIPNETSGTYKYSPSPKKNKKKDHINLDPNIALGTSSGLLLIYSIGKANVSLTLDSKTNSSVNCLSPVDENVIYSGADQHIFLWNIKRRTVKSQWQVTNERIISILVIRQTQQLLTASKSIKLWDIVSKQLLKTFIGHSAEVVLMSCVCRDEDLYLLSGSKEDRLLSCWNLKASQHQKNTVCNYLMEDIVRNISVNVNSDGSTTIAASTRSGVVHIYQHKLNGQNDKPLKPKTTIQVVSEIGHSDETVSPLRISGARLQPDGESLCIGYGSQRFLTFENVVIATTQRVHCLVRKDPEIVKSKTATGSKTKIPLTNDVHYLTPNTSTIPKRKFDGQKEVPMEQRLENLILNKVEGATVPKSDNVAQLLLQGLHSKDKNLLRMALSRKDEDIIRNTIKRLPVAIFEPLVKEVSSLVNGKTVLSYYGALWLKNFARIHAGVLISNPNLSDMFAKALASIQARNSLFVPLNRLRGKLELMVPQITVPVEEDESDEAILFNDKDSDESGAEVEMQMDIAHSDSENEWDVNSLDENHIHKSSSDSDDSVVMLPSD